MNRPILPPGPAVAAIVLLAALPATAIELALPTPNTRIYKGGADYFMYVNRTVHGQESHPWEGGQYGFVRTPITVGGRTVYRQFHEGVDIKPVSRDGSGIPTDPVMAVDAGVVRHVNPQPGGSNYGKYIVIEHDWDNSPVVTLYAHLREIDVHPGQNVAKGQKIGMMGWTGAGIDVARSHLHFEIDLILNSRFERWHDTYFKGTPNPHGIYNGLNLTGIDPVKFYQAIRNDPTLTFAGFVRSQPWFYKVRVPNTRGFELVRRYPWLAGQAASSRPASWEIAFAQSGLPVGIEPSDVPTQQPKLMAIKNSPVPYSYVTRGIVTGSQGSARLSESGGRTFELLTFD